MHQMATCPNSRGCRALGHFLPTCLLKPLNPFIGYESHIQYVVFKLSSPINNLCANKIRGLTIVYGFYFTQCVCKGSIERSTLSLNIYIMYSWFSYLTWHHAHTYVALYLNWICASCTAIARLITLASYVHNIPSFVMSYCHIKQDTICWLLYWSISTFLISVAD